MKDKVNFNEIVTKRNEPEIKISLSRLYMITGDPIFILSLEILPIALLLKKSLNQCFELMYEPTEETDFMNSEVF
jgi:hypothetical protein